jgi:hypothetical protein
MLLFQKLLIILLILYLLNIEFREHFIHIEDACLDDVVKDIATIEPYTKNLKFYTADKSYTINKKLVYICVKDESGNYYTKKQLTVVCLHELAHAMNKKIGHGPEFQAIFQSLLDRAEKRGLIDADTEVPKSYCGIDEE